MKGFEEYSPRIEYTEDDLDRMTIEGLGASEHEDEVKPRQQRSRKTKGEKVKAETKSRKEKAARDGADIGTWASLKTLFDIKTLRTLAALFLSFLALYFIVAFISFLSGCIADQSMVHNTPIGNAEIVHNHAGEGGARLANALINDWFGLGSLVIIVWLAAMALKLFGTPLRFKSVNFTIKCLIALIAVSLIIGLVTIGLDTTVSWGGMHGRWINEQVVHFVGWAGALILCCFVIAVFVLICMRDVVKWLVRIRREKKRKRDEEVALREAEERRKLEMDALNKKEIEEANAHTNPMQDDEDSDPNEGNAVTFAGDDLALHDGALEYAIEDSEPAENEDQEEEDDDSTSAKNSDIKGTPMKVNVNTISDSGAKTNKSTERNAWLRPYKFPPYDLMNEGTVQISVDQDEQMENEERIRKTLLDFGINIISIEATVGPTVTLYEIVPDKGVKIARIRNLVDDIALSLAATGVRIIAPIPGRGTVGIEVANKDPQTVSMRTIIKSQAFQNNKCRLPIALGSTISNQPYIADLAKMPHLLVAGATGQGKSVGLNAIITSLLYSKTPDELKFVMIDPKMVEFSFYEKIEKYYLAKIPGDDNPIITDMSKVVATLSSLCVEMDNRYLLLRDAHARNIEEYNPKVLNHEIVANDTHDHRFLPYIVVVVDEFSDLIMTAGKEVEMPIARLAQKARAVGMHVIIATQRPSTNVITGIIKANFPARIAFKVGSGIDSKTILDCTGAQQLIGRGDMLISQSSELIRVQCAFMDTPEVEHVCDHIAKQPYPRGVYELPEPVVTGDDGADDGVRGNNFGDRDPLFEEVARAVVISNTASTSSLQRRYSIGYNRAGKIMDQLEAAGIVGPSRDGKPRSVLVDAVTLDDMLSRNS